MHFQSLAALALAATGVLGYENSSPLFIHSTSSLRSLSIPKLASASKVETALQELAVSCPSKNYLIVSQPGVSASDFSSRNAPMLNELLGTTDRDQTSIQVREVVDTVNAQAVANAFAKQCSRLVKSIDVASMMIPEFKGFTESKVFTLEFPSLQNDLTTEERRVVLQQHDTYLSSLIDTYFSNNDYTLIYTTTSVHAAKNKHVASEGKEYQAELPIAGMMHSGELRRSIANRNESYTNQTVVDGPLFDKYQFLSPGIFMGLFVAFILFSLLYVGISALSSLQVTYGAFDKDQGQLAAKKQQ